MRLLNLLEGISWECLQGKRSMEEKHSMDKEVSAVVYDSRKIVETRASSP